MKDAEKERLLAECLSEYHARRARQEAVRPEDFLGRLGDLYPEFVALLAAEKALDQAMTTSAAPEFPIAFGDYTLLGELGRGGVGVVYEAIHRPLGRKVAVKVLRTGFDTDEKARKRFEREAMACAQVRHEHLVTIYESGCVGDRLYYAMDLLPGSSLQTLIQEGRAPQGRALYLGLARIADALQALHDAGIFHRDVKPANIVVEPSGRMVLTDFGLARTALSIGITATAEAVGTPRYMSPEAMLGEADEIDGRTDVYSLGATLYHALTGQPPFRTEDPRELYRMVLREAPAPPRRLVPSVSAEAETVALTALKKRREDRYQTAARLRDDLLALAEGKPVSGSPVPAWLRFATRHRRTLAPLAAALVLATLGTLWWVNRDGLLVLTVFPAQAQVRVGGRAVQRSPAEVRLASGTHAVTAVLEHFWNYDRPVDLGPGERVEREVTLRPKDETGMAILRRSLDEGGMPRPERLRAARDGSTVLLRPRGLVRLEDLDVLEMYLGEDFDGPATLEIRRGDEVLLQVPGIDSSHMGLRKEAVPDALRSRLRPGDWVSWSLTESDRQRSTVAAEFEVAGALPEAVLRGLARVEEALAPAEGPTSGVGPGAAAVPWQALRAEMRARLLLKHRFVVAALREVAPYLGQGEEPPSSVGVAAAALEALRRLELRETPAWHEAMDRLHRLPSSEVDRFYEAEGAEGQ